MKVCVVLLCSLCVFMKASERKTSMEKSKLKKFEFPPDRGFKSRSQSHKKTLFNGLQEETLRQKAKKINLITTKKDVTRNRMDEEERQVNIGILQEKRKRLFPFNDNSTTLSTRYKRSIEDPCAQFGKCNWVSQLSEHSRYCHCDDVCHMYDDCCPEIRTNASTNATLLENQSYRYSCLINSSSVTFGVVITGCSKSFRNDSLSLKCSNTNVAATGPWVFDGVGNIYRNMYCALCNNIQQFTYFSMAVRNIKDIEIKNQVNKTQKDKVITENVGRSFIEFITSHNFYARACVLVDDVANSSDMCESYGINPVHKYLSKFRNAFCADSLDQIQCADTLDDFGSSFLGVFPMTVLFLFTKDDASLPECQERGDSICYGKEIYTNYRVKAYYTATINSTTQYSIVKALGYALLWSLHFPNITTGVGLCQYWLQTANQSEVIIEAIVVLQDDLNEAGVLRYEEKLQNLQRTIVIDLGNEEAVIDFKKLQKTIPLDFARYCRGWAANQYSSLDTELSWHFLWNGDIIEDLCSNMVIHVKPVNVNGREKMEINDSTCQYIEAVAVTDIVYYVKVVITYLGFSLSIISLAGLIIVSWKFGHNNTTAGTNSQNIYLALLVALCLFLFGIGLNFNKDVCKTMAIALHYSWLTVFSFKSIAIISLVWKLQQLDGSSSKSPDGTFKVKLFFRILGLCLPLPFVVTLAILDRYDVLQFFSRQHQGICFPTAFPANLIFVTAPILTLLLVNITCLLLMIIHIRRIKSVSMRVSKSNSYNEAIVYLRVSVLSGLPWVFGVVGSFVQFDTLDFIFILLCSFQGVFIVVSNVTTRSFRQKLQVGFRKSDQTVTKSTNAFPQTTNAQSEGKF